MPTIMPVSRQRHGNKQWQRFSSYSFAAKDALAPLALAELPKAAAALPIAFILQNDRYIPAALMGFQAGQNLMVSPTGQWLGRYIPAAYRSYPFMLLKTEDGQQQVMCIDETAGLLSGGSGGELFFDRDDQPSKAITQILDFLNQTSASRKAAEAAGAALQRHSLICSWPLTVQSASGEQRVDGLFQVDEAALNALAADALLELRDAGALVVAYLQLLSMQHLGELARLATERNSISAASADTDINGLANPGGTFSFGNLT